jgi:UDP-N-acetylglucosamine--N-acetylmuramyl-(pentapeptide) pyrophosphoryl-undecaprenol N-acetylglucosamine transferase
LGFEPQRPVVLVVGGSQGASAINEMIIKALPNFARVAPEWQWLHLAGPKDLDRLEYAYAKYHLPAIVEPFLHRMELAMGAASAVISRAGASSLAELAAMRLPALLVPFPEAHDNHQWHNAHAFAGSGAAWFVEQKLATPELLVELMLHLVRNESVRLSMQAALALWERPRAAESIADNILELITTTNSRAADRATTAPIHSAAPRQKESATAC